MRLSTTIMYELGMTGVQRQSAEQIDLQQKISLGKRVSKPSDDPIAAAAAIGFDQGKSVNEQFGANAANAQSALTVQESALADAMRVLQEVKTLAVYAGNAALTLADRSSIANDLQAHYDTLLGIANRTDGNGTYLFSGFQGATQPFNQTAPGVVNYAGDEGIRLIQIGPQRRIPIGDNGAEIFQRIREGNGTFVATPDAANTGGAVAGPGNVTNPQAWAGAGNSGDYEIVFHVDPSTPPVTTYDIVDNVANLSVLTGAAPVAGPHARVYQPNSTITFARQAADPSVAPFDIGINLDVSGVPVTGDSIRVSRSQNQDVFTTLNDLIDTLKSPVSGLPASRAEFQNALNRGSLNVDRALDQVLTARSAAGSRLRELDSVQQNTEELGIFYEGQLARLQDLDYAKAVSDLTRNQIMLEAAQKSYLAVTRLSLFDLI